MTDDSRARLNAAVHAYRQQPDPAHLAPLRDAGLDGIAMALEVEATALPGIGRDNATARINGWLRPQRRGIAAGVERNTAAGGDGFGLGGSSPTSGPAR